MNMKELINLFLRDIREDDFTTKELFIYGITGAVSIVTICIISEIINAL